MSLQRKLRLVCLFFFFTVVVYDPVTVQLSLLRQSNLHQSLKVKDLPIAREKVVKVDLQKTRPRIRMGGSAEIKVTDTCSATWAVSPLSSTPRRCL